jgi:hypothetical protein
MQLVVRMAGLVQSSTAIALSALPYVPLMSASLPTHRPLQWRGLVAEKVVPFTCTGSVSLRPRSLGSLA